MNFIRTVSAAILGITLCSHAQAQTPDARWRVLSGDDTQLQLIDAATIVAEGSKRTFWHLTLFAGPIDVNGNSVDETRFHEVVDCQARTYQPLSSHYYLRDRHLGSVEVPTPVHEILPDSAGEPILDFVCLRHVPSDLSNIPLLTRERAREFLNFAARGNR